MPRDFEQQAVQQEFIVTRNSKNGKGRLLVNWDPELYRSKLWPVTCLFGVSFGALHLASWNIVFPTLAELWIWRISAIVSMVAILVFMQFEKVFRWRDPATIICIISVGLYILSRIGAMVEVFISLRGSEPGIYET